MSDSNNRESPSRGRILVVEDDRFYQEICRDVLREDGYEVDVAFTGEEALSKVKGGNYHILLVDLVLPGMDGINVLSVSKQVNPSTDVILMTGYATVESAVKALKRGASDYLTKPVNPEELKLSVKRCREFRNLFEENNELRNMIRLYQTSQLLSNTLELEQLYPLALDIIIQEMKADVGIGLFRPGEGRRMQLMAYRGISEETARRMAEEVREKFTDPMPREMRVTENASISSQDSNPAGKHALILPLKCEPGRGQPISCDGLVVAWRNKPFAENNLQNIRFLAEQISMSLENAVNYRDAQEMIFVDDLTGLYNMRYLDVSLDNEIKRAKRFKKGLGLLFVDLDHFKNVNDDYGHLIGSKLLKEVADSLLKSIREIDTAIRYGGDEFILILPDTSREGSIRVAERLREHMENEIFLTGEELQLKITCCIGVAAYPEDAENPVDLIHLADKAMYKGKETTRNRVCSVKDL